MVMLSYRGYGKSEGTPNEKGLKIDAQVYPIANHIQLHCFSLKPQV